MKQFAGTLAIVAITTAPVLAQSELKVSLNDHTPITVSVDGRHFQKIGESVTVNSLPKGKHYVVVFLAADSRAGHRAGIIWQGKVKTYFNQQTNCVIDPYTRQAVITEQDIFNMTPATDAQTYSNYNLNNYDTRQVPDDNGYSGSQDANSNSAQSTAPDNTQDNNGVAPLPDGAPVASPVSEYNEAELLKSTKGAKSGKTTKTDSKTEAIKSKINAKATDTDKLEAAKAAMKKSSVKTTDVMMLMDCFNFESTKVEFAKWAYTYTSDKANYKQVKQKLTMKQYREEMDTFLKNN